MVDDLCPVREDSGPQIRGRSQSVGICCVVCGKDFGTKGQGEEGGVGEAA